MKVLVVGGGGREHALVWKIAQSPLVTKIFAAPGNGGIAECGLKNVADSAIGDAECVPIPSEDIPRLADFAREKRVDLTVVGPEIPLTLGIVDEFEKRGSKIFGPSKRASLIEGSKAFAKEMMEDLHIPTGEFETFTDRHEAIQYIREKGTPIVIKASGLSAGKGVTVARDLESALKAVDEIMTEQIFGDAGKQIVVEEFLEGDEASVFAFTDGERILPTLPAQDHKSVYDGDQGPNTGGMGAYAPASLVDETMQKGIEEKILQPCISGMAEEGRPFKGILYAGLMITEEGPKVLEFNSRFGDPETQAILPLLETDLVEIMLAVCENRLHQIELEWSDRTSVCVVLASGGYPGSYEKGKWIQGLEEVEKMEDVIVFHAGTRLEDHRFFTQGGRVLGVTGIGDNLEKAIEKAYSAVERIHFEGMHYRKDIGFKGLVKVS